MTNKMFYAALARLLKTDPAVHVAVYVDGSVGLRVDGGSTQVFLCPITYVTYRTTGRYYHMASAIPAGEALGLSPRQARQIMLAADSREGALPQIRRAIQSRCAPYATAPSRTVQDA